MNIYFEVIKFNFLKFLTYPTEIFATAFRRLIEVIFLIIFWHIILNTPFSQMKPIISYFLIAQSVSLVVMARRTEFGTELRRLIKYGVINIYLVRPMRLVPYLYASTLGNQGLNTFFSAILIILGLIINPPSSIFNILAFLLTTLIAAGIAFAFNLVEGVIAFYITETGPVSGSIRRIIEVFSGAIAPLSFFPTRIAKILQFSPFPAMVYGPTTSLASGFNFNQIMVSLFWLVTLNFLVFKFWHHAIKHYEAIGI